MRRLKIGFFASVLLLAGCDDPEKANYDPAYAPVANPQPKYFMTVKGKVDPDLASQANLKIISRYITDNHDCSYTVNSFEGIASPRHREFILNVQLNSYGNYEVKVPINLFQPDKCNWIIETVAYSTSVISDVPILIGHFAPDSKQPLIFKSNGRTVILCPKGIGSCKFIEQKQYETLLPRNHNYIFELDILSKFYD